MRKNRNNRNKRIGIWMMAGALACSLWGCREKIPPGDPFYKEQENLSAIGIEDAWRAGLTGKGVRIAVIDTGAAGHEDLDEGRISGRSYVDEEESDYNDTRGHGTAVTGILAAVRDNGTGIAGMTDSEILVLKVLGDQPHIGIDHVAQALRDAADEGCDVINVSMGTPNESQKLKDAVDYAVEKGAIVIAAAGGDEETPYYPAAYDDVVGVDALNQDLEPMEAGAGNKSVFVTAPGEKVITLDASGGYERDGAGSSYAAAQVTGLAAFAKQEDPGMTAQEFMELLRQSVTDKGDPGYDLAYGWGVIDAGALAKALSQE